MDFINPQDYDKEKTHENNIEVNKPFNKEDKQNYSYYNNIKLYSNDILEKTTKIKKSLNPYESIYKINTQIKKENEKKIKNDKEKSSNNLMYNSTMANVYKDTNEKSPKNNFIWINERYFI